MTFWILQAVFGWKLRSDENGLDSGMGVPAGGGGVSKEWGGDILRCGVRTRMQMEAVSEL